MKIYQNKKNIKYSFLLNINFDYFNIINVNKQSQDLQRLK